MHHAVVMVTSHINCVCFILQASCNDDLEWYKSVKETQGSVEVTSFGQMENILNCGCYTVGGRREIAMDSVHDVIRLTLVPKPGVKLLKAHYSLDELRDLESKLVLITGSKAKNRGAVEHFLDVTNIKLTFINFITSLISHRPYTVCVGLQRCSLDSSKWGMFSILVGEWSFIATLF